LAVRLTEATAAALTAETGSDRYATVLDALAYSPVRTQVKPLGIPAEPTPELLAAVKKAASRLPAIAALFGIEATAAPKAGKPRPKVKPPRPDLPPAAAPVAAEPTVNAPVEPVVETESVATPAVEAVAEAEAEAEAVTEAPVETVSETDSEAEQSE
jgi:hypothetical protein